MCVLESVWGDAQEKHTQRHRQDTKQLWETGGEERHRKEGEFESL